MLCSATDVWNRFVLGTKKWSSAAVDAYSESSHFSRESTKSVSMSNIDDDSNVGVTYHFC